MHRTMTMEQARKRLYQHFSANQDASAQEAWEFIDSRISPNGEKILLTTTIGGASASYVGTKQSIELLENFLTAHQLKEPVGTLTIATDDTGETTASFVLADHDLGDGLYTLYGTEPNVTIWNAVAYRVIGPDGLPCPIYGRWVEKGAYENGAFGVTLRPGYRFEYAYCNPAYP